MGRPEQGLKDLVSPRSDQLRFPALESAGACSAGQWADAREKFKNVEFAITSLPLELQRAVITEAMQCFDRGEGLFGRGEPQQTISDVIGIPADLKPAIAVCGGGWRALGREKTRWRS